MNRAPQLLVFLLDRQRFALDLMEVDRVVPAVDIIPLPQAPDIVLGIINVRGRFLPVVDMRGRFGLPARAMAVTDHIILARSSKRPMALLVDTTDGTAQCAAADIVPASEILAHMPYVDGVAKLPDGTTLIHDLDSFLSLDEDITLSKALDAKSAVE